MPTVPKPELQARSNALNVPLAQVPRGGGNTGQLQRAPQVNRLPVMDLPGFKTPTVDAKLSPASSGQLMGLAAQQVSEWGGAISNAAGAAGKIALDIQNQTNQLVVDNATNNAKEMALRLAYDPEEGFTNLRGWDALHRPNDKPLTEEYLDKFREGVNGYAEGLTNDVQREAFRQASQQIGMSLENQLIQHEASAYKEYNTSTQEGTIKTSTRQIQLNYNDPEMIDQAEQSIRAATTRLGMANGKSAIEIESDVTANLSQAHKVAIGAALEDDNILYAQAYLTAHAKDMTGADVLQVRGLVSKEVDQTVAYAAANKAIQGVAPAMGPITDFQRVQNITAQAESGGRERDANGNLITSSAGAQGKMQVMPGTNKDPGFGVRPAADDSDAERTRVGNDYLAAMAKRYGGDPAKMWAAYNAGPGRLDDAMKKANKEGKFWLELMPKETQGYVQNNVKALGQGQGVPTTPSLGDALATLRNDPVLAASPRRLQIAEQRTTQLYQQAEADKRGKADSLFTEAAGALAGGKMLYEDLPVAQRAAIESYAPEKVGWLRDFAIKSTEGDHPTDFATYQLLADDTTLKNMSDADFAAARGKLSNADWQQFAKERGTLRNPAAGGAGQSPGDLNSPVILAVLKDRLTGLGITDGAKAKDEDKVRAGAITRYVRQSIGAAQAQAGKKFTDVETEKFIDGLFAKSRDFHRTVFGFDREYSQPLLSMKLDDVPPESQAALREGFKKRGISDPSDADMLAAYWKWKG